MKEKGVSNQVKISDVFGALQDKDPQSSYLFATALIEGVGQIKIEKDSIKGANLLKSAAKSNHGPSAAMLYEMYKVGEGVEKSDEKAFEMLLKATKSGDLKSYLLKLAVHYHIGDIAERDFKKAFETYSDLNNDTVNQDIRDKAVKNMAAMYLKGEYVEKNYVKYIELLEEVAERGDRQLQLDLANAFMKGNNEMEADISSAINWFTKIIESDQLKTFADRNIVSHAHRGLGSIYSQNQDYVDYEKSLEHYVEASSLMPTVESAVILGREYLSGTVLERNLAKAYQQLSLASDSGDVNALIALALMTEQGLGCQKRFTKAASLLQKAADLRSEVAKKMLDELEEAIDKGVPVVHEVGFESVLGKPFEIKIVEGYQDDEQFEQEEHTVLTDSEETEGLNQEEADAEKISEEIFVLEENNAKDKLEESGIKQDEVDLSGQESSLGNAEFNL